MKLPTQIRPANQSDIDFVFSSWLESYRFSPIACVTEKKLATKQVKSALLQSETYYKNYRKIITKIIEASNISIICNKDDNDQIFGFLCHRPLNDNIEIISYIYIKQPFRRMGMAKELINNLKSTELIATHAKLNAIQFIKHFNMVYNPFLDIN